MKKVLGAVVPLLLVAATLLVFQLRSVLSPAWAFDVSIETFCKKEDNSKGVNWSFDNTEPDTPETVMDLTVSLAGQPDQVATVNGGSTATGTFALGTGVVPGSTVEFKLSWHDGQQGTESISRSFDAIEDCVLATATSSSTPNDTDTPTATDTATGTETTIASETPSPTSTNTDVPNTDTPMPTDTDVPGTATTIPIETATDVLGTSTATQQDASTSTSTLQASATTESNATSTKTATPSVTLSQTSATPTRTQQVTQTGQPTETQTTKQFTPPTGVATCEQAEFTNNADVGLHVVLKVDGVTVWFGDVGVYSTLTIAWSLPGNHTATLEWSGAGLSGVIGLGNFGPCGETTGTEGPLVNAEGTDEDVAFTQTSAISFPRLGVTIPIGPGNIQNGNEFHHALGVAGQITDNDFGIHQHLVPQLKDLKPFDEVAVGIQRYWVERVVLVLRKDQVSMERLMRDWATVITCTPDWAHNLVILLRPVVGHSRW